MNDIATRQPTRDKAVQMLSFSLASNALNAPVVISRNYIKLPGEFRLDSFQPLIY